MLVGGDQLINTFVPLIYVDGSLTASGIVAANINAIGENSLQP